jgi:hypothetical protein
MGSRALLGSAPRQPPRSWSVTGRWTGPLPALPANAPGSLPLCRSRPRSCARSGTSPRCGRCPSGGLRIDRPILTVALRRRVTSGCGGSRSGLTTRGTSASCKPARRGTSRHGSKANTRARLDGERRFRHISGSFELTRGAHGAERAVVTPRGPTPDLVGCARGCHDRCRSLTPGPGLDDGDYLATRRPCRGERSFSRLGGAERRTRPRHRAEWRVVRASRV